jgi:hypothetical protein
VPIARMGSSSPMPGLLARTATGLKSAVTAGVVFERWVTPTDAGVELALFARWN